jgi:hypothetical protein
MDTTDQQTCAQRIREHQAGREASIAALNECADAWGDGAREVEGEYLTPEEAIGRLDELPLAVERFTLVKVLLSTGGPADWLEVRCDEPDHDTGCRGVLAVSYHFADWFDHASEDVPEDSALWAYAERICEVL